MTIAINKTFIFEKEETQQSCFRDYELNLKPEYIDLNKIIQTHCPLTDHNVSIYNPDTQKFTPLNKMNGTTGLVPRLFFQPNFIMIRFNEKGSMIVDSQTLKKLEGKQKNGDSKDPKNKQRTIGETLGIVKEWRNIHLHGITSSNKRLNLQESANILGISKKSLDDYYCQLRLGERYHFDYVRNISQKIGILRAFVKIQKQEDDKIMRNIKLPRNLKIIKYFEQKSQSIENVEGLMREKQYTSLTPFSQREESMQMELQEPLYESSLIGQLPESSQIDEVLHGFYVDQNQLNSSPPGLESQFLKAFDVPYLHKLKDSYETIEKGFGQKYFGDAKNNSVLFD